MRRFFILYSLNLEDFRRHLPIVMRSITAALMISHGLRLDSHLTLYIEGENHAISFYPDKMRRISPDESSMSGVLRKALRMDITNSKSVHPGVIVSKKDIKEILRNRSNILFSDKKGVDIRLIRIGAEITILIPLTVMSKGVLEVLKERKATPVRISKKMCNADALITIVNNEIDRRWLIARQG